MNVVPSTLAPSLGVGQRGVKTDKKNAQNLSLASSRMEEMPRVHVPSKTSRERRALLASRALLVGSRTALISHVRGWARTQLLVIPSGKSKTFPERAREAALGRPEGLPEHIERVLLVVEEFHKQLKATDEELDGLTQQDAVCKRLMSVPGVGPVTSATFQAVLDDRTRFKTAHAVENYLGLTPGEKSSGQRKPVRGLRTTAR